MRLDKYLKTARILKRREAAKQLALEKRILLNGRVAKPSSEVEIDDRIVLEFGNRILEVVVKDTPKQANKEKAALMFEVLRQEKKEADDAAAGN
ncbi:RNA-binding S4 domain-containing protein [Erysipelotrichaceae bacterium RD49]|nr:RNA-binding S4 domain-containing protein [Erysipelotrichaceae bacterium RD49]